MPDAGSGTDDMKRTVLIIAAAVFAFLLLSSYLWTLGLTPVRVTSQLVRDSKLQVDQSRHTPMARIFDFSWQSTWEIRKSSGAGTEVLYTTDKASISDRAEIGVLPTGKYFLRITDTNNHILANMDP
jgi:hypothetical protein